MRLVECNDDGSYSLTEDLKDDEIPPYAILTHVWEGDDEVTYQDFLNGTAKDRKGYYMIEFGGKQARRDGLRYFFASYCVDPFDEAGRQKIVESIAEWHRNAKKRYVYLPDVTARMVLNKDESSVISYDSTIRSSQELSYLWRYQEGLVSSNAELFSADGIHLGDKQSLERIIAKLREEHLGETHTTDTNVEDVSVLPLEDSTISGSFTYRDGGTEGKLTRLSSSGFPPSQITLALVLRASRKLKQGLGKHSAQRLQLRGKIPGASFANTSPGDYEDHRDDVRKLAPVLIAAKDQFLRKSYWKTLLLVLRAIHNFKHGQRRGRPHAPQLKLLEKIPGPSVNASHEDKEVGRMFAMSPHSEYGKIESELSQGSPDIERLDVEDPAFHFSDPTAHAPFESTVDRVEDGFLKDFICCGRILDSLHELLRHHEEVHMGSDFPLQESTDAVGPAALRTASPLTPYVERDISIRPDLYPTSVRIGETRDLPESTTVTNNDSGYSTARHESPQSHYLGHGDGLDDARTVYSNDSLDDQLRDAYAEEVAESLFNQMDWRDLSDPSINRVCERLPEFLKAFALRLCLGRPSQDRWDTMAFIHKHRSTIARCFRQRLLRIRNVIHTQQNLSDEISLTDKMELWGTHLEPDEINPEQATNQPSDSWDGQPSDSQEHEDHGENDEHEASRDHDIRRYMEAAQSHIAFSWLLSSLSTEVSLEQSQSDVMESIRHEIIRSMPSLRILSRRIPPTAHNVAFILDWDPMEFLRQQNADMSYVTITDVITLTGNSENSQALPCAMYLRQTWPSTAESTLELLHGLCIKEHHRSSTCTLSDGTQVMAHMEGSYCIVEVTGTAYSIAEVGEQFAWLGAAMRASPHESTLSSCFPSIEQVRPGVINSRLSALSSPVLSITYIQTQVDKTSQPSSGCCWQSLFASPVIVKGYPVRKRKDTNNGLEAPLDMLATLVGTERLNLFDQNYYIKGFSSMLVLTKFVGEIAIWHYMSTEDNRRISYLEGCFADKHAITLTAMMRARHIVGWCSSTTYHAGGDASSYAIDHSGLPAAHKDSRLYGTYLDTGHLIKMTTPFVVLPRDNLSHLSHRPYWKGLLWLERQFVVLWDEEDKRGWLVNGTSALLHVLRASLEYEREKLIEIGIPTQQLKLNEAKEPYKPRSAICVLLDDDNQKIRTSHDPSDRTELKSVIKALYNIFEQIIEHQIRVYGPIGSILTQVQPRQYLEGWDFKKLATDQVQIVPCVAELNAAGRSWVDLTRDIRAVTIFGRGFGEIIRSSETPSSQCSRWSAMPKQEYYLAATVHDLQKITEEYVGRTSEPGRLTNNIAWHQPVPVFGPCHCAGKHESNHSDLISVIMPSNHSSKLPFKCSLELKEHGAVIFGQNANFPWAWGNVGEPKQESCPPVLKDSTSDTLTDWTSGSPSTNEQNISSEYTPRTSLKPTRRIYKIGIICALEKELMAVRILFDQRYDDDKDLVPGDDDRHYSFGRMGRHNVVAACLGSDRYGTVNAASVASNMKRSFRTIHSYLLVGIGGGVPSMANDIRLGDVVVGRSISGRPSVLQYDMGKAVSAGKFMITGTLQETSEFLASALNQLLSDPVAPLEAFQQHVEKVTESNDNYKRPDREDDVLYRADYIHEISPTKGCESCVGPPVQRSTRAAENSMIHYGLIASGNKVMRDASMRDRLGEEHGILCFEMEAAGVLNAVPCLVVRGICDYSDSHKHKEWQEYACATAAAFAKLLLTKYIRCSPEDGESAEWTSSSRTSFSPSFQGGRKRRRLEEQS